MTRVETTNANMGSPSFLAHQRALERRPRPVELPDACSASTAIPSDNYIRLMLDGALAGGVRSAVHSRPSETAGATDAPFQRLDGRVLIALDGTRAFLLAQNQLPAAARHGSVPTAARNTSTPSWAPPSSRRATSRCCRCRRSSSPRRTGRRSRTASATPPSAGWPGMAAAVAASAARLSRRRSVRLPADRRRHPAGGRQFHPHLQAVIASDHHRIPARRRTGGTPPEHRRAKAASGPPQSIDGSRQCRCAPRTTR